MLFYVMACCLTYEVMHAVYATVYVSALVLLVRCACRCYVIRFFSDVACNANIVCDLLCGLNVDFLLL